MEIVAVAALGLLGYELKGRKTAKPKTKMQKRTQYFEDQNRLQDVDRDFRDMIALNHQPATHAATQPYHNNMTPFFGSQGSQNTSDSVKQSRLNTFTGTDVDFHQPKRESVSRVRMSEGKTNIYGNPVMSDEERMRPFTNPLKYNNVNADPSSNQRVGPGLGAGVNVASAGGFHPESVLRVLPDNVNEYRVNQLDSIQANPAKAFVDKVAEDAGEQARELVPRFYEEAQHPTLATGGVIKAQAALPEQDLKLTRRGHESFDPFLLTAPSSQVDSQGRITDYEPRAGVMTEQCHRSPVPASNLGPTTRESMYYLPENDREKCTPILNLTGTGAAVKRDQWEAKTTLRQCGDSCVPVGAPGVSVSASQTRADNEHRLGRQTLPNYNQFQNYDGPNTSYVPLGQTVCKTQNINTSRVELTPAMPGVGMYNTHSQYDIVGRPDQEYNYHGLHGQGTQQLHVDVESYDLKNDEAYFRAPVHPLVYATRGSLGEVELS